jgi:hypothetical protein
MVKGYSLSVTGNANNHEQITDNRAVSASNNRASGAPFLLIAGARTDETAELLALAESLIPGRYKILTDCPRDQMPDLYRAMDVFVLPSLFEMMPIALLEALASGLPCVVNHHPVLEWMIGAEGADQLLSCQVAELSGKKELSSCSVAQLLSESPASPGELSSCSVAQLLSKGPEVSLPSSTQQPDNSTTLLSGPATQQPSNSTTLRASGATQQPNNSTTVPASGGIAIDMGREGALAEALAGLTPDWLELHGRQARERALTMFSKEAVIRQYVGYYEDVMR